MVRKLEPSTILDTVAAECHKRLEELIVMHGARDRVDGIEHSNLDQFFGALDALVSQVSVQLMDYFSTGFEDVYNGSQLPLPFTLAHAFGVGGHCC